MPADLKPPVEISGKGTRRLSQMTLGREAS